ncbi:hypothetical protein Tco_0327709 [Tanacetum coccineum]
MGKGVGGSKEDGEKGENRVWDYVLEGDGRATSGGGGIAEGQGGEGRLNRSNFESKKGRFIRGGVSGSRSGAGIYRGGAGPNYEWEQLLDIDDSDLPLTLVLRPYNSHRKSWLEQYPVYAGIVQVAKLLKQRDIVLGWDGVVMLTQEYMKKVVEDVGEDEDFKSGVWVSVTEYVNANGGIVSGCLGDIKNFLKNGKLEQVVTIIKSCNPNAIGDLTVTLKDLSSTIHGTIHHKVIDEGGYGKDITVGSALILANVSVFSPKLSMHYLNITMRNVIKVFHKDSVPGNGSGVGGSGMLMEEEEIVKLMEEEEMADLKLQVCWNVTHQEDLYKFNEEALNLTLEEEARQARAEQEYREGSSCEGLTRVIGGVYLQYLYWRSMYMQRVLSGLDAELGGAVWCRYGEGVRDFPHAGMSTPTTRGVFGEGVVVSGSWAGKLGFAWKWVYTI